MSLIFNLMSIYNILDNWEMNFIAVIDSVTSQRSLAYNWIVTHQDKANMPLSL